MEDLLDQYLEEQRRGKHNQKKGIEQNIDEEREKRKHLNLSIKEEMLIMQIENTIFCCTYSDMIEYDKRFQSFDTIEEIYYVLSNLTKLIPGSEEFNEKIEVRREGPDVSFNLDFCGKKFRVYTKKNKFSDIFKMNYMFHNLIMQDYNPNSIKNEDK